MFDTSSLESGKTMGGGGVGGVLDAGNQIQNSTTQNYDSTNDIYCIVCSKCKKLYVWEKLGSPSEKV